MLINNKHIKFEKIPTLYWQTAKWARFFFESTTAAITLPVIGHTAHAAAIVRERWGDAVRGISRINRPKAQVSGLNTNIQIWGDLMATECDNERKNHVYALFAVLMYIQQTLNTNHLFRIDSLNIRDRLTTGFVNGLSDSVWRHSRMDMLFDKRILYPLKCLNISSPPILKQC